MTMKSERQRQNMALENPESALMTVADVIRSWTGMRRRHDAGFFKRVRLTMDAAMKGCG